MDNKVAILVISHKENLSPYEKISIQQCIKKLGHYPTYFICPQGLNIDRYKEFEKSIQFDFIPAHWQSSYQNFNRLKVLPFLYRRYREFDYVLFYEPDAFVFRDELPYWIEKGYDYIGAPWLTGWDKAGEDASFLGVGNGGFSLRKTNSMLKVLYSFSYITPPSRIINNFFQAPIKHKLSSLKSSIKNLTISNNTFHLFNNWSTGEDKFWGKIASKNFDWFSMPPPLEAIQFSMEVQPKKMYELNNHQLPFGCHAWWKYDLDFWRPFIEAEGYDLAAI